MEWPVLSVDIETYRNERASSYFCDAEVSAPKNYRNDDSIKKYKEEALEKLQGQASFKWWLGKICCISWTECTDELKGGVLFNINERELLRDFYAVLVREYPDHALLGKNFKNFDYGFLVGRGLANREALPPHFKRRDKIIDLESLFHFSTSSSHHGKLTDYAFGFQIAGKTEDMDGSKIQPLMDEYLLGNPKRRKEIGDLISKYCLQDSRIVAQMFTQYRRAYVLPDPITEIPF